MADSPGYQSYSLPEIFFKLAHAFLEESGADEFHGLKAGPIDLLDNRQ